MIRRMPGKKERKLLVIAFIVALLLGFAVAFWLFYRPQEFIYTFF
jgi:hypothetical protein